MTACSVVKDQLRPERPRWPWPKDARVTFDGPDLRVRTESRDGAQAAHAAAEAALLSYLEKLDVLGAPEERAARIKAALHRAAPFDGRGAGGLYTSDIDVPLSDIQELLGTYYEPR